ncbi:DUF3006 domain-containing protein [Psychrobacillus sp. MER TA 17]|nr:DUF3006 domain-containing protein [Psychrobacillus sp. MER TA 17]
MIIFKAVIDRIEEDIATIIIKDSDNEYEIRKSELPEGSQEGHWLLVEISDGIVKGIEKDLQETEAAKMRIQEKRAKLNTGNKSKFKK